MNVILNLIQDLIGKQKGRSSVRFWIKSGMTYSLFGILLLTHSHKTDTLTLSSSARAAQNDGGKVVCHSDESQNLIVERFGLYCGKILKLVQNDKIKDHKNESQFTNHYSLNNDGLLRTARNDEKRNHLSTYSPINLSTCKKKAAFTLAEVLITLGIIGVVAAMTIPNLITSVQKQRTATQLKKAFAEIAVAVRLSEGEHGDITGWTYDSKTSSAISAAGLFDTYLIPFMKISRKEVRGTDLVYYKPNNQKEVGLAILRGNSVSYTLLSGVQMIASNNSIGTIGGSVSTIGFILDLNGYESMPNRFGRDAFYVVIYPNEGVHMFARDDGEKGTVQRTRQQLLNGPSAQQYQCNSRGRGIWCGALIQKDGWKISPDYPWK